MSVTREIPPEVQAARRRLTANEDISTIIQWMAQEHGVGSYPSPGDQRTDDFESGQRRAITFLAEQTGVDLILVRGKTLKAEKPKPTENDETTDEIDG